MRRFAVLAVVTGLTGAHSSRAKSGLTAPQQHCAKQSATFSFAESNNAYSVEGATYATKAVGGLMFAVTMTENGSAYYITVMVTNDA